MLSNSITMHITEEQNTSNQNRKSIFDRMKAGGLFQLDDPEYPKVLEIVSRTITLSAALNTSTNIDQIRERLSEIIDSPIDNSTAVFTPFLHQFWKIHQNRQKRFHKSRLYFPGYGWNYDRR